MRNTGYKIIRNFHFIINGIQCTSLLLDEPGFENFWVSFEADLLSDRDFLLIQSIDEIFFRNICAVIDPFECTFGSLLVIVISVVH